MGCCKFGKDLSVDKFSTNKEIFVKGRNNQWVVGMKLVI